MTAELIHKKRGTGLLVTMWTLRLRVPPPKPWSLPWDRAFCFVVDRR